MEVKEALTAYGIPWDGESLRRLEIYRAHLKKRNAEMDLTSVPDEDTAERHFADSLMPLRFPGMIPDTGRAADVGSGAGFPGLALAVFRPGMEFFLIEAQEKRCAFLRECAALMGLGNVKVLQRRGCRTGRETEGKLLPDGGKGPCPDERAVRIPLAAYGGGGKMRPVEGRAR